MAKLKPVKYAISFVLVLDEEDAPSATAVKYVLNTFREDYFPDGKIGSLKVSKVS